MGRIWSRGLWILLLVLCTPSFLGCGRKKVAVSVPTAPPVAGSDVVAGQTEEGIASWYGHPYHGRRTANGEVYDMRQDTAAHQTLPFGTRVRVTNLENQRTTEVRINDRGPFVRGRIIDLSRKAAEELDMIGPGTARVRLEILSRGEAWQGEFTVQVGAFRERSNAERLKNQLRSRFGPVTVERGPDRIYRVRVGRLSSRSDADRLAQQLRRERGIERTMVLEVLRSAGVVKTGN